MFEFHRQNFVFYKTVSNLSNLGLNTRTVVLSLLKSTTWSNALVYIFLVTTTLCEIRTQIYIEENPIHKTFSGLTKQNWSHAKQGSANTNFSCQGKWKEGKCISIYHRKPINFVLAIQLRSISHQFLNMQLNGQIHDNMIMTIITT